MFVKIKWVDSWGTWPMPHSPLQSCGWSQAPLPGSDPLTEREAPRPGGLSLPRLPIRPRHIPWAAGLRASPVLELEGWDPDFSTNQGPRRRAGLPPRSEAALRGHSLAVKIVLSSPRIHEFQVELGPCSRVAVWPQELRVPQAPVSLSQPPGPKGGPRTYRGGPVTGDLSTELPCPHRLLCLFISNRITRRCRWTDLTTGSRKRSKETICSYIQKPVFAVLLLPYVLKRALFQAFFLKDLKRPLD